jgi:hypothetical protein
MGLSFKDQLATKASLRHEEAYPTIRTDADDAQRMAAECAAHQTRPRGISGWAYERIAKCEAIAQRAEGKCVASVKPLWLKMPHSTSLRNAFNSLLPLNYFFDRSRSYGDFGRENVKDYRAQRARYG